MTLAGKTEGLAPGDEVRFDVLWPHEDNDGIVVPPGRYLVHAYMHVSMKGTSRYERVDLATAPQEFEIVLE